MSLRTSVTNDDYVTVPGTIDGNTISTLCDTFSVCSGTVSALDNYTKFIGRKSNEKRLLREIKKNIGQSFMLINV